MSEIAINDLPNELIIEILQRVNRQYLGNAILTCKLWKQLIESSCSWSLILNHENRVGHNERWVDFMLTTNRKFHKIKIDGLVEMGKNRTIDIFRKHGSSIVKLLLFQSCVDKFDLFVEMLKCLPNLQHVIMFSITTLCRLSHVLADLPELSKLKTLEVVESEYSIIKCFTRAQLKTLKILSSAFENPMEMPEPVTDLLRKQPQLTSLVLRSIHHETSQLFRTECLDSIIPFQLTKLSLLDIQLRESPNDYSNLLKFMKHQAKTIKELELGHRFPDFVYEFVFAQLKNLKSLRLLINELPREMEFYKRLAANLSINNLILIDSPTPDHNVQGCQPTLQEFFRRVPNVTNLTLMEYYDHGTTIFIANHLNKLNKLTVKYFGSTFDGVQFPKLTSLNICRLYDRIEWGRFTKQNSQITELTVATVDMASNLNCRDVVNISKNLKKLQTLRIDNSFVTNEILFVNIRKNCLNLKTLDLRKSSTTNLVGLSDVPGLRFYEKNFVNCFKDLEFWNDDDYSGKLPDDRRNGNWHVDLLAPFDIQLVQFDDFDDYQADYSDFDVNSGEDDDDDVDDDSEL